MGGNNSRCVSQSGGDTLPAKFRPLLRQRIEEFRNRRNARREESAVSKKELLKDDDVYSNARSSNANDILEETQPHKDEKTTVPVEKLSQVAPLPVYENGNKKEKEEHKVHKDHDQEKNDKDIEKKIAAIKSALLPEENKHDNEEKEEDEDKDEDEDDIGRLLGPRSPSFRIYCIEAEERKEQELCDNDINAVSEYPDGKENQDIDVNRKSVSTNSDDSVTSESENADYSNEAPKKKRNHKRKKLEAMKNNLLNIKNIQMNRMNRMMGCTGNNDRTSLII